MAKEYKFSQSKEDIQGFFDFLSEKKEELETLIEEAKQLKADLIAMRGDDDTTEDIDTVNEMKGAMAGMKQGDTVQSVAKSIFDGHVDEDEGLHIGG